MTFHLFCHAPIAEYGIDQSKIKSSSIKFFHCLALAHFAFASLGDFVGRLGYLQYVPPLFAGLLYTFNSLVRSSFTSYLRDYFYLAVIDRPIVHWFFPQDMAFRFSYYFCFSAIPKLPVYLNCHEKPPRFRPLFFEDTPLVSFHFSRHFCRKVGVRLPLGPNLNFKKLGYFRSRNNIYKMVVSINWIDCIFLLVSFPHSRLDALDGHGTSPVFHPYFTHGLCHICPGQIKTSLNRYATFAPNIFNLLHLRFLAGRASNKCAPSNGWQAWRSSPYVTRR